MTIGEKIKYQRKLLGLTQTELGERLGVKTNAVSKWECGRVEDIPTSKIKAMATLFEVPTSYLIDDDEAPKAPASDTDIKAAFFGGIADDLTPEEREEYWDDARAYLQFKLANRKKKKE